MKKYQNLLFDLDDTLLDYGTAEKHALIQLFQSLNIDATFTLLSDFKQTNIARWKQFEKGAISWENLMTHMFDEFIKQRCRRQVPGQATTRHFLKLLSQQPDTLPGAKQLLQNLKKRHYHIYGVTNGVQQVQAQRLQHAGLAPFFDDLFVSQTIGNQKPAKAVFDYVFTHSSAVPQASLMIGDSLSSDIQGGINAQVDTLWFNSRHLANPTTLKPTYEVHSFKQLQELLA